MDIRSKVAEILKLPPAKRQRLAEEFLVANEETILNKPVSEVRPGDYVALIALYQDLAQIAIAAREYQDAIHWFDKCVVILNRDREYRLKFSLIYWRLAQCHCKVLNYHKAAQNLYRFQAHADHKRYSTYIKKLGHIEYPFKKVCEKILGQPI
jgi:tetratricopeptide (TPR) repeat protein